MTLNSILWRGSISRDLGSMEYSFTTCSENWDGNCHLHISTYAPCARYIFLTGCPERVYIANGHKFSRQQSHKTTENEDTHANEGQAEKNIKKQQTSSLRAFFFALDMN